MGRKGKSRKSKIVIPVQKRGLILCEGKTEENYFKGLISQNKYRRKFLSINVEIHKPKDYSPQGLVSEARKRIKEAKREKNKYDFVWVIFDKDRHTKIPDAFESARISNPEVKIAFTIPCFEFFVLLHFEKTTKPFDKCEGVISYIKSKKYIEDYEKNCNIFEVLFSYSESGLTNSKWVLDQFKDELDNGKKAYELSSYCNVHELVNYLYGLVDNFEQKSK